MFNLIISGDEEAWERPSYILDDERFLEYTDDRLKKRFQALDDDARDILRSLPTLFAYERAVGKPARVGTINTIEKQGRRIRITYTFHPSAVPVDLERVRRAAWEDFEMNRTHWAVKEGDILDVVGVAPRMTSDLPGDQRLAVATPSFSRKTLLAACDVLSALTHAGFDRFLLEVGIDSLNAGREGGRSLAKRANVLAEFLIRNPSARTVEGELLALRVVRQAVELEDRVPEATRAAFRAALGSDGFDVDGGKVVPFTYATIKSIEIDAGFSRAPEQAVNSTAPASAASTPPATPMHSTQSPVSRKVFLVHGRDDAAKNEVAYYLAKLGLEPVILHERPSKGRTLITKFREEAEGATYAVVLVTPDDVGGIKGNTGETAAPRARQNVVFELGFFIGKLGPERVCALVAGEVEKPSDYAGVVYVSFGPGTNWQRELAREMHAADLPFDPAKAL